MCQKKLRLADETSMTIQTATESGCMS